METSPVDFNALILVLQNIRDGSDSMVSAADVVDIIREQLGLPDVAPTSDASSSESVGSDNRHQDQRSTSASNTDADDNEEEDEDKDSAWLENYRNEDGLLINDEGRIRIHEPFSHDGAKGFAPPLLNIQNLLYLPCDCAHHALPECCLDSDPPFNFFINHYDESLKVYVDSEFHLASTAFTDNNPLRPPNNRQRHRLYKSIYLTLDFGEILPGERRKLPNCVCAKIRQLYPDESGCYMEFSKKAESLDLLDALNILLDN